MATSALIDGLNEQLNREVTTFLRYMLQAARIRGARWEPVREMYLEEVKDEIEHAQYLANQISLLGGKPALRPDLSEPPADVLDMLKQDAKEEETDVRNYVRLAHLAEQQSLMALKMKMEEQAADEGEHRMEMLRLQES